MGFDTREGQSQIIAIYIDNPLVLQHMSRDLIANGVYTVPVTFPAVPVKDTRFRFIVNAAHTKQQIDHTLAVLV